MIAPVNVAAVAISLALQFTGTAIAPAMTPVLVAWTVSVAAYFRFLHHTAAARRSVAERLGIDTTARRLIDFRGHERFDRSVEVALSKRQGTNSPGTP